MTAPRVIAIIPALDEEECIRDVVTGILAHVDQVVVVDNGSHDQTASAAREAGADVVSEPKRGYGRACLAGLARAKHLGADVLVFLDADGSDDAADAPSLLAPVLSGDADIALGVRRKDLREPGSMTTVQGFGNWFGPALMRVFLGAPFHDMPPFKVCRAAALHALRLEDTDYGFTIELLVKAHQEKLKIVEVDVHCRARRGGASKVSGTVRGASLAAWKIMTKIGRYAANRHAVR